MTTPHERIDWDESNRIVTHDLARVFLVPRRDRLGHGRIIGTCRGWCGRQGRDVCTAVPFDERYDIDKRCPGETDATISRFRAEYLGRLLGRADLGGRYIGWDRCAFTHARGAFWGLPTRRLYLLACHEGRFALGVGTSEADERSLVHADLLHRGRVLHEVKCDGEWAYVDPSHFDEHWDDTPIGRAVAARNKRFHLLGTPSGDLLSRMIDQALVDLDVAMERRVA